MRLYTRHSSLTIILLALVAIADALKGHAPLISPSPGDVNTQGAPTDRQDGHWMNDNPPLSPPGEDIGTPSLPKSDIVDNNNAPTPHGTTGHYGDISGRESWHKIQENEAGEQTDPHPEVPPEEALPPILSVHATVETSQPSDETLLQSTNNPQPVLLEDNGRGLAESDNPDGIIQPLHSFLLSLSMILFSEIGDKTFLVAALMAMKHDRMTVFTAAFGALLIMTILSALLGHTVPSLIPQRVTSLAASGLFFMFGLKLLREGMTMSPDEGVAAEMHEVEHEIAEKEKEANWSRASRISADTLEMGLNDRKPRSRGRFPTPARSPSLSPGAEQDLSSPLKPEGGIIQGLNNLFSLLLSPAWVQTFVMTFLAEWGDRSQIATIAMAAGQDYWWVTFGAMFGHAVCTGVAVLGGRAVAGRVSLKVGEYCLI
jgi:putative Ca2+/H+ antiporter (TMEM165/GDT1 family)